MMIDKKSVAMINFNLLVIRDSFTNDDDGSKVSEEQTSLPFELSISDTCDLKLNPISEMPPRKRKKTVVVSLSYASQNIITPFDYPKQGDKTTKARNKVSIYFGCPVT